MKKIANGRDLCNVCMSDFCKKHIVDVGTKSLMSRSREQILEHARIGGVASSKIPNSGRFNSERWSNMPESEQRAQVLKANKALHEKLNSDPDAKRKHFKKVHAQKGIGYISKGHKSLHAAISNMGFKTHIVIDSMEVDECNEDLRVIVEYNGDYWHCNPSKYDKDYYNKSIKMTAGQKWKKDIARNYILKKLGYKVIVVWESDWKINKDLIIEDIERACYEAGVKNKN